MGQHITFFREKTTMPADDPKLKFQQRSLVPYDVQRYGSRVILYYAPGTPEPDSADGWVDQLKAQGWRLVRRGRIYDHSIEVVCEKVDGE